MLVKNRLAYCFCVTVIIGATTYPALCQQPSPSVSSSPSATEARVDERKTSSKAESFVSPEMIAAIGSLWPLAVLAVIAILIIILRKPLRKLLENIVTTSEKATNLEFKTGPVGLSMKSTSTEVSQLTVGVRPETQKNVAPAIEDVASIESKLDASTEGEPSDPSRSLSDELFDAIINRSAEGVESAYARMQEAEANAEKKIRNEAIYLYARFRLGDSSAIRRLEELTQTEESAAAAYIWLALCYQSANDQKRAGEAFERGAEKETDLQRRAHTFVNAANCYSEIGVGEDGIGLLCREIAKTADHGVLAILYKGLASLYKAADKKDLQVLALEKAVEYAPNDTSVLFDAAYAFSESEMRALSVESEMLALSVAHYGSIVNFDPAHAEAMNNLGVAYQSVKMPIHAVSAYQKAVNLGNTLASANVAYLLMEAGFATEAKETLDKARLASDVHANVGSALAALAQKKAAEDEKEKKIDDSALT